MPPAAIVAAGIGATGLGAGIALNQQKKAQDLASQRADEAKAEQRRLEEKYGLTPGELDRQDRTFALEKQQQDELQRRAGLSGEQLIREQGDTTAQLLDTISKNLGLTGQQIFENAGDINKQYVNDVTNFDQTFAQQELAALFDEIVKQTNRRGVLGPAKQGSITLENLGRAGVDFAVQQAKERLAQRAALSEAFVNLTQNARAEAGNVASTALDQSTLARQELNQFLANMQNLDQASKGRAAEVGLNTFNTTQGTINQFSSVPIDIAAFNVGQGTKLAQSGLNAIGSQVNLPTNNGTETKQPSELNHSFLDEYTKRINDPYYGIRNRTGSGEI